MSRHQYGQREGNHWQEEEGNTEAVLGSGTDYSGTRTQDHEAGDVQEAGDEGECGLEGVDAARGAEAVLSGVLADYLVIDGVFLYAWTLSVLWVC